MYGPLRKYKQGIASGALEMNAVVAAPRLLRTSQGGSKDMKTVLPVNSHFVNIRWYGTVAPEKVLSFMLIYVDRFIQ